LSPFAGIASEGYESIRLGRKFIGIELKQSYFDQAVKNMMAVEKEVHEGILDFGGDHDDSEA
jgi:DNA modification methylase